jgi:hypothetical protein
MLLSEYQMMDKSRNPVTVTFSITHIIHATEISLKRKVTHLFRKFIS